MGTKETNIINLSDKVKQKQKELEQNQEYTPLEIFQDSDVTSVFMSLLLILRSLSISNIVNIRMTDDQLILESKNFVEFSEGSLCDSSEALTNTAAMYIVDEHDNLLNDDELLEGFQEMIQAVTLVSSDEED